MPVRIRLARFGRKNLPFYRIFVADSRSPRDGRHLEVVGHFDPIPGELRGGVLDSPPVAGLLTLFCCSQGWEQARGSKL